MADITLPDVYQADLDEEAYHALLADLASLDALEVAVKHTAQQRSEEGRAWTLAEARAALDEGRVRALQVRYAHEGQVWIDTLVRTPSGVRLVRIAAPLHAG